MFHRSGQWAFWGGMWGLVYGFFEKWFPEKFFSYWIVAILYGAIFPTLACGSSSSRSKVNRSRRAGIRCGWRFMP
jgi:hypothetical protein